MTARHLIVALAFAVVLACATVADPGAVAILALTARLAYLIGSPGPFLEAPGNLRQVIEAAPGAHRR